MSTWTLATAIEEELTVRHGFVFYDPPVEHKKTFIEVPEAYFSVQGVAHLIYLAANRQTFRKVTWKTVREDGKVIVKVAYCI